MTDKPKLPESLTIATQVLPPTPVEGALEHLDFMTLIGRINAANHRLQDVIAQSGNGVRFRETRDSIERDMAAGK